MIFSPWTLLQLSVLVSVSIDVSPVRNGWDGQETSSFSVGVLSNVEIEIFEAFLKRIKWYTFWKKKSFYRVAERRYMDNKKYRKTFTVPGMRQTMSMETVSFLSIVSSFTFLFTCLLLTFTYLRNNWKVLVLHSFLLLFLLFFSLSFSFSFFLFLMLKTILDHCWSFSRNLRDSTKKIELNIWLWNQFFLLRNKNI
jgi:hypothetical protein